MQTSQSWARALHGVHMEYSAWFARAHPKGLNSENNCPGVLGKGRPI